MEIAGRPEVALVGEIGSLADQNTADCLRHQPVEVCVTLTMGMRAHVDRHVIDVDGHVGAVVEIVATQEVLVGFALAAVLRDDQSGGRLEDFARARRGACIHLGSRNGDLAGQAWSEGGAATHVGRAGRELRTSIDGCARRWGFFGGLRRLGGYFLGWRRRDDDARKLLLTKRPAGPDEIPS